ncbi:flavin reductase family protein [Bradyrhizobium sp.]|uniref:flavin reductase family protein n=1 Tax=Bradyrhizobium sp. TaxID=376 RepID=UPI0039E2826D
MSGSFPEHGLLAVARVISETIDATTIEIDVPADRQAVYAGRAGQFVRILIPGDPEQHSRSYSLSSTPELEEPLRFTVKRVVGGAVSERLTRTLSQGDYLRVDPPAGAFTLRDSSDPLVLIAGGSGITPLFSLLKAALKLTDRPVTLLCAHRNQDAAIFAGLIAEYQRSHPERLSVRHHHSDESGFLTESDVIDLLTSHQRAQIYLCGPAPLMDLVEKVFDAHCPADRYELFCERFLSPTLVSNGEARDAPETVACNVVVRISGEDFSFPWSGPGSLLDDALTAGVPMPHSCRDGHCGACKARLVEGDVEQDGALALSKRDHQKKNILACCSRPRSPSLVLDYD